MGEIRKASHPDDSKLVTRPRSYWEDPPLVREPSTFTVDHEHKPLLYLPNGKALVKRAGF